MILSWQQIPSTIITEILSKNFDGVVLDIEHGIFNPENIFQSIQILRLQNKKSFVRLTEISKTLIRYCLDAGVDGLIFSTIETKEQCEEIIQSCYYPNKGKRGLGLVAENGWGEESFNFRTPIIIPQIETKKAIDNLEEIISYKFDYYLVGPYDLSLSLGIAGEFDNSKFLENINIIKQKIPEEKLAIHIPKNVEKELKKYKNYGIKCLGMDTTTLIDGCKELANELFRY